MGVEGREAGLGNRRGLRGGKKREAWSQPRPAAASNFPESSAAQESPSSHRHLPQCREWRMRNLDGHPLLFPLPPCTPGGED